MRVVGLREVFRFGIKSLVLGLGGGGEGSLMDFNILVRGRVFGIS